MSEKLEAMRHSASHVMAEAVKSMFSDAKFGIGPAIEDGFYYDFDLPRTLTPEDLSAIETKMAGVKNIIARERFDLVPLLSQADAYYDIALARVREVTDPSAVE